MISTVRPWVLASAVATLLSACAGLTENSQFPAGGEHTTMDELCNGAYNYTKFLAVNTGPGAGSAIKVSATGFGAPPKKYYPDYQRRLMAMRASRIDAYRAMAESINGIRILGDTTLGDMIVEEDSSRAYVDGFIRGARTTEIQEHPDGSYQTTLETYIDEKFFNVALSHKVIAKCDEYTRGNGNSVALQGRDNKADFYLAE